MMKFASKYADDVVPGRYYIFQQIMRACWSARTSAATPEVWGEGPVSTGQCAVTALLFQDVFGGELLRSVVNGESHYWNLTEDGVEVDFTRSQFQVPLIFSEDTVIRDREYVLGNPNTAARYETLKETYLSVINDRSMGM